MQSFPYIISFSIGVKMLNKIKNNYKILIVIGFINLIIFGVTNLIFDIKYEQVDDFIIYNLYSGLDRNL